MLPPCVAFGAFPPEGDATSAAGRPLCGGHWSGLRQFLSTAPDAKGS